MPAYLLCQVKILVAWSESPLSKVLWEYQEFKFELQITEVQKVLLGPKNPTKSPI